MKITVKNSKLEKMFNELDEACKSNASLDPRAVYAMVLNRKTLEDALAPCQEAKRKVFDMEADESGGINTETNPEGAQRFMSAVHKIDDEEVEVEVRMIPWKLLNQKRIPINVISAMGFMLEGEIE